MLECQRWCQFFTLRTVFSIPFSGGSRPRKVVPVSPRLVRLSCSSWVCRRCWKPRCDQISSGCFGFPYTRWTCLVNIQKKVPWRHPNQVHHVLRSTIWPAALLWAPSRRLNPATLLWNLNSAASVCDLILSLPKFSAHTWELDCTPTGNSKLLPSGSASNPPQRVWTTRVTADCTKVQVRQPSVPIANKNQSYL